MSLLKQIFIGKQSIGDSIAGLIGGELMVGIVMVINFSMEELITKGLLTFFLAILGGVGGVIGKRLVDLVWKNKKTKDDKDSRIEDRGPGKLQKD